MGLKSIAIPVDMFTVRVAIGGMPGWIAGGKESTDFFFNDTATTEIYTGKNERDYTPIGTRG